MLNNKGFTLIEVIAVLLLVGVITAVAGMAIVSGIQGYLLAEQNTVIGRKAQLINARLMREMTELTDVDISVSDSRCVRYKIETISPYYRTVGINGEKLAFNTDLSADCDCPGGEAPGSELADGVDDFQIAYLDSTGAPATKPDQMALVKITYNLKRMDGTAPGFSLCVNPRNTGNGNAP